MSGILNLRCARDLRPGDVIIHGGYPADLIDIIDFGTEIQLIWSVCPDDQICVGPTEAFNVIGHMS